MTLPAPPDGTPDWPHWEENARGCWELAISEIRKRKIASGEIRSDDGESVGSAHSEVHALDGGNGLDTAGADRAPDAGNPE